MLPGLGLFARKQPIWIRSLKWRLGKLLVNQRYKINRLFRRCQIGDRHFPNLIAAKRIKGQNQIYGLFASKEETLRHSAVCVYDLADISRQMRDAQFLGFRGLQFFELENDFSLDQL